jgi:BTB/POZ domain
MKTEELNDSSSASIVEIATNGDITLVVGPEKRKLQVNSCVLKNASKVFNAMLGPQFREGQDLHGNSPKEIIMPDDNADALTIICRILHLRNDSIPDSRTPSEVLQIAIAADTGEKYEGTRCIDGIPPKKMERLSSKVDKRRNAFMRSNSCFNNKSRLH